jgi:SAM-dependent methyltransferase
MRFDQQKLDTVLERAVGDLSAGYGGAMVSLGDKLGLYRAMAGAGPLTPGEVAVRSGCAERYVREWLNAQAAGGYVDYHPTSGTYELTPEQGAVLADPDSPLFIAPAWDVPASMFADEPATLEAFRTGRGVAWADRQPRMHAGVARFYRNGYRAGIATAWIPALDGVAARLQAGGRVADIGCGFGHSTVAMAEAYPASTVHGIDSHPASILAARIAAQEAGVDDRVSFEVADATTWEGEGYDLIAFFDALHDMGDPVGVLSRARAALAPGGTILLVEPFAGDRVEDNLTPVGRLYYAASAALCLTHARSEGGFDPLGAQAGAARIAEVCRRAGLAHVREAVATPFNLVLEVRPDAVP